MTTYKKDPYEKRLSYWKLTVSYPASDSEGWRVNNRLGIVVCGVEDAISEAKRLHPGCEVWSISHQGTIDNLKVGA